MDKKELLGWFELTLKDAGINEALNDDDKEAAAQIRRLVESGGEKRTVSREQIDKWALNMWALAPIGMGLERFVYCKHASEEIINMLSELGYEMKP